MTIKDINKTLLTLLREPHPTSITFRVYLSELFDKYYKMLEDSRSDIKPLCFIAFSYEDLLEDIKTSCKELLSIYDLYMQGRIGEAVSRMKQLYTDDEAIFREEITEQDVFYRARTIDYSKGAYNIKEMFHVPFEKRGKISNFRYSIAGYPCLYLGSSILTCWEEMHKPNPNNLCVSRFTIDKQEKLFVIDLSWDEDTPEKSEEEEEQSLFRVRILRLLRRYPLMIACSIRAYDANAPFKEEYVIPQTLLMSCIGSDLVDGIAYTSTRRDAQIATDIELHKNYVFPAQRITDTGYCERLSNLFCLTHGVSFMEAEIKNVYHRRDTILGSYKDEAIHFDTFEYGKTDYQCTKLGQLEEYLGKQSYYKLQNEDGKWIIHPCNK